MGWIGQRNGAGGKFMRDDRRDDWDGNDLQCCAISCSTPNG